MHLQHGLALPKPPTETAVVVAMSGGVDSSVAAARLVEAGYRVHGIMLRLWVDPFEDMSQARENRCCTFEAVSDAQRIADQLGIPFQLIHASDRFKTIVVDYFIQEYSQGRTPNPCLMCNRRLRFDFMLRYAREALGADFLATGHYARLRWTPAGVQLLRGADAHKDQSYVLSMVPQEALRHLAFPVGDLTKPEVRALARRYGLRVATKSESQDLCFTSDYRNFLRHWADDAIRPGPILDLAGRELGQHHGLPFYTIGQRKGLGVSSRDRLFVVALERERNAVIVGPAAALERDSLIARDVNWISDALRSPLRATVKIRYKSADHPATLIPLNEDRVEVRFDAPVRGVTPGQGVAFYQGDACLGGGFIESL
ncbi:MAG TPA: tRNA 2-thiouridine(34) synthase MnmA [Anaerolineae bacterium]|nr:tRNA 2-thiouridine(34) synthase MnmA [Caldilineae bacterium]HID34324.1 tRNA 2-thiouridine(34) synthase MnmA [Anaerolineae bacterium]HIQ11317.1 tRNA 2-thiouridine(34) synthase MnmA [Caldilineales bacterium]